jgi:cell division protease FtsH
MHLPEKERKLVNESYFKDTICTLLGGYVAEKMVFGELTTGASDDLRKAYEMARKLVTEYGMSEKIGPLNFGTEEETVFLGREIGSQRVYSEKTAQEIDLEIEKILREAQTKTERVLRENKDKLDNVSHELIKKETIEKEEFRIIMGIAEKKVTKEEKKSKEKSEKIEEEKKK